MEERFSGHHIEWTHQKSRLLWNYYSAHLKQEQYFSFHSGHLILREVKKSVDLDKHVLDFGCGPGFLIGHLLNEIKKGKVYGLDFSSEAVAITNRKFQKELHFGGAFLVGGFPSSFDSSSMDVIVSVEVIEHLDDHQLSAMLKETHRLLRSGGKLIITTPNNEDMHASTTICPECGCIFHRWQHIRVWDGKTLREWLKNHHFKPLVVKPLYFQPLRYRLFDKAVAIGKKLVGRGSKVYQPHLFAIAEKRA